MARENANGARAKSGGRTVPVGAELIRLYADYLHGEYGALGSDYVFVNLWAEPRGQAWSYPAAYNLVTRVRAKTGLDFDPHWFRHSAATRWLRDGVPAEVVSRLLGHSSVTVTLSVLRAPDGAGRPGGAGEGRLADGQGSVLVIPAGQGSGDKRPGLLASLVAAVRPEFRAGVLVFDPGDPVFGGRPAASGSAAGRRGRPACATPTTSGGSRQAAPTRSVFAATAGPLHGHAPPAGCRAAGCGFGALRRRLCQRHLGAWVRAGEPDIDDWLASVPPAAPQPGQAGCRVSFCPWWAHPRAVLCYYHHRRWKALGCPDLAGFLAGYERPADADRERADLTALPAQLRLEVQYALQCRRDEATLKTRPATIGSLVRWLAASGAVSLLDRSEQAWRQACRPYTAKTGQPVALLIYARRKVTTLAEGQGWDNEYPRDTWQLRRLGIDSRQCRHLAVHRDQPAVAEGPGQAVDPVAAVVRAVAGRLLPRRARHHHVRRVPGRRPGHRGRADQPGRPGTLPGRPQRRPGRHA